MLAFASDCGDMLEKKFDDNDLPPSTDFNSAKTGSQVAASTWTEWRLSNLKTGGIKVPPEFESHSLRQRVFDVEHCPENCAMSARVRPFVNRKGTRYIPTSGIGRRSEQFISVSQSGEGFWPSGADPDC